MTEEPRRHRMIASILHTMYFKLVHAEKDYPYVLACSWLFLSVLESVSVF